MDPMEIFKNLQNLQSQMGGVQDKMKDVSVIGTSGGDMVSIEINGAMEVTGVKISPEIVNPDDVTMLEDLVLAALTDAGTKIKVKLASEMSSLTGNLGFPG
ncbi:MAG: YbaB/EbfC family nucleoid-associated protein [Spirochaetes bacterium]|nr:MAG: YbaB/EbfC family nucleoid-associated protein [Spirochaetota bacterium]